MKRIALFALVMLSFTLSSCQCAWPPPIGPVEGEEDAVVLHEKAMPAGSTAAVRA